MLALGLFTFIMQPRHLGFFKQFDYWTVNFFIIMCYKETFPTINRKVKLFEKVGKDICN